VLARMMERQLEKFLMTVKMVPADKLTWAPKEGMRSALDQFQEVATVIGDHWSVFLDRKMEMNQDSVAAWILRRSALTDLESLEKRLREDTQKLVDYTLGLADSDLLLTVEMPVPGDFRVADLIQLHTWNMSYHEGQINSILHYLGTHSSGD
jgi:uncharacterized damage-inducible protein DinB